MLKKKSVTVPARQIEHVVSVICDLCGEVFIGAETVGFAGVKWPGDYYDTLETDVKIEDGHNYGEDGGQKTARIYHVCPECFKNKLEPWLKAQGAEPTVDEIDW